MLMNLIEALKSVKINFNEYYLNMFDLVSLILLNFYNHHYQFFYKNDYKVQKHVFELYNHFYKKIGNDDYKNLIELKKLNQTYLNNIH